MDDAIPTPLRPRVSMLGARFGREVERLADVAGLSFTSLAEAASKLSGLPMDGAVVRKAARCQIPMPEAYVSPLADAFGLQGADRDRFIALGHAARANPTLVAMLDRFAVAQGVDLGLVAGCAC